MIINDRKDLDAAPTEVRERFINALAGSINKYRWDDTEWVLEQDTAEIERFNFTLADFPDAPTPDKPAYNPDERALEREAEEVRAERDRLLADSDWAVLPDAPVADEQAWAEYRQTLRDVPDQGGFPTDIDWPEKPGGSG